MKTILLDTNIVSYLLKNHSIIELYRSELEGNIGVVSFMTAAELLEGAYRLGSTKKAMRIFEELDRYEILPFLDLTYDVWGKIRASRRTRPISVPDAWVAATALVYDLPLVTHNFDDFQEIDGLHVISQYVPKEKK